MKRTRRTGVFCAALMAAIFVSANVQATDWEVLFDGKNLDAWDYHSGVWEISGQGELHPVKRGPSIFTKKRYCDFVLELDVRMATEKKSNSGVSIRVHDRNKEIVTGMEVQILDNTGYGVLFNAGNANGALYNLARPSVEANKPVSDWQHFKITADKNLVTVQLNGKQIVKADLDQWGTVGKNPDGGHNSFPYAVGTLPREGFICLQNYNASPVWFRNIKLQRLGDRQPKHTGQEPIDQILEKVSPITPMP